MADLILDNLIFDLQPHGGISSIWEALVRGAAGAPDIEVGFIQRAKHRERLGTLTNGKAKTFVETGPIGLSRFLRVNVPPGTQVFHSSYFRIAENGGVRNVVTIHDCIAERFDRGLRRLLHVHQKERALKHAARVICVSNNTRNDLISYYPWLERDRVVVVHNGIDLDYFTPDKSLRSRALLYVGARNAHKNFELALRLLATKTACGLGLTLDLVGGGAISSREQSLITSLRLQDRIRVLGSLPRDSLRVAYRTAFALIYPSLYEGFGIPPLEAMACGCPVLCSNTSSLPEVVGEAAELFNPLSVDEAEQALARINAAEVRATKEQQGYSRVRIFDQQFMVASTLDIFRGLLKDRTVKPV